MKNLGTVVLGILILSAGVAAKADPVTLNCGQNDYDANNLGGWVATVTLTYNTDASQTMDVIYQRIKGDNGGVTTPSVEISQTVMPSANQTQITSPNGRVTATLSADLVNFTLAGASQNPVPMTCSPGSAQGQ